MHTSNIETHLVFESDGAIYQQIADYFKRQVATGHMSQGDRLPAIRLLAKSLGLDPGTVARAYEQLERDGVIKCRRGGGSFVSTRAADGLLAQEQRKRLTEIVDKTVVDALGLGFSADEVKTSFSLRLARWRDDLDYSANEAESRPTGTKADLHFSGSHDLAVELLATHLSTLHPDMRCVTSFVGSLSGLMALGYHEADIAGAHLLDADTGEYNVTFIRKLVPNENVVLINLVQRVQGLIVASGNPKQIIGISDLKRPDITVVNRQKGSGTRILLDSQLHKLGIDPGSIKGYEREERTHITLATHIAQGKADVGLGAQSAAALATLDFIPLLKERYDLVIRQENMESTYIKRVMEALNQGSFRKMIGSIPGYDLTDTGTITTVIAS